MMVKVHTSDQKGIKTSIFFLDCLYKHHFGLLLARSKEAMMITKVENANVA